MVAISAAGMYPFSSFGWSEAAIEMTPDAKGSLLSHTKEEEEEEGKRAPRRLNPARV